MTDRATYTVSEAAKLLGISRNAGYEAARRGELPVVRIGRRILVPRRRLEALLNGDGTDAATPVPSATDSALAGLGNDTRPEDGTDDP